MFYFRFYDILGSHISQSLKLFTTYEESINALLTERVSMDYLRNQTITKIVCFKLVMKGSKKWWYYFEQSFLSYADAYHLLVTSYFCYFTTVIFIKRKMLMITKILYSEWNSNVLINLQIFLINKFSLVL